MPPDRLDLDLYRVTKTYGSTKGGASKLDRKIEALVDMLFHFDRQIRRRVDRATLRTGTEPHIYVPHITCEEKKVYQVDLHQLRAASMLKIL